MKTQRLQAILAVLFAVGFAAQAQARTFTIMPLGDSITYGAPSAVKESLGGYRTALFEALSECGQFVQFVGPNPTNASQLQINAGQQYHAGFGGYRIDHLNANLDGDAAPWPGNYNGHWLTGIPGVREPLYPDIILVMAGTNDILQKSGVDGAFDRMNTLVARLLTMRPDSRVIVAKIAPIWGIYAQHVIDYNNKVAQLVSWYAQEGFHISSVDQHTPFVNYSSAFKDSVHPSDGLVYRAMGYNWLPKVLTAMYDIMLSEQAAQ